MKAAFLSTKGFEIKEVEIPSYNHDEVLIKSTGCGICEGDVFQYNTRNNLNEEILLGHEGSGVIVEIGKNVKGFKVGDRVTSLGGKYAEYFVEHPDNLVLLPQEIDPLSALGEPIACFVHASSRFGTQKGDRVAVIGCGYMGTGCIEMVKIQGAGEIIAIEPLGWRRTQALKCGATSSYDPTGKTADEILADLGEFDIVIEAAGAAQVIDTCTALVKQHGTIVLVGYHQSNNGARTVDMKTWNFKAINVINGHVRRNNEKAVAMKQGMELQSKGQLKFDNMIEYYKINDISKAFESLNAKKEGLYKAVLSFN
ncbi:MAG: zinc-binding dehydrogenase [Fibrobacteres bacterium]|nr:zinc-binding dehydrogenase [Fibrobacterota bacterium]